MPEMTITSTDGTKLAARWSGNGSPMVLVHGALGDLDDFALVEGLLAERHSVWVYSRRARGGSGDGPDYAVQREVEDVLAVVAAAGDGAHLVGHSFGAVCCLFAATRSPSLRSLVLYEPPLRVDRMDRRIGDDIQAALDAGNPDRALEIFFTVADIVDAEAQVLRSLEPVWETLRAGVRCVPREGTRTPGGSRSAGSVRASGCVNALSVRKRDQGIDLRHPRRGTPTPAEGPCPRASRTAPPRVRLRPNVVRPGDPRLHRRTRRLTRIVERQDARHRPRIGSAALRQELMRRRPRSMRPPT